MISSCVGNNTKKDEIKLPVMLNDAPDGKVLKAGLIGEIVSAE